MYPSPPLFTPQQWRTLYSMTSLLFPTPTPTELATLLSDNAEIPPYRIHELALHASNHTNPLFKRQLELFLATLPGTVVFSFGIMLSILGTLPGSLLITGSPTPFHQQPEAVRRRLLKSWVDGTGWLLFPPIRTFARAIANITTSVWAQSVPVEVLYGALGYVGKSGAESAKMSKPTPETTTPDDNDSDDERGWYNFDFLTFPPGAHEHLQADVVVVGSGCGGAVAAKRIAEAGHSVIVVDKGKWYHTGLLPLPEHQAVEELFENKMALPTEDGGLVIAAATTWGGGGAVNWCASLQTQEYVREEWANEHKLPFFKSVEFQECLDLVCTHMGVTSAVTHNHRNVALLAGAEKLGYRAITVPQNTSAALPGEDTSAAAAAARTHDDAYCCFGCGCRAPGSGRKMGTTQTWLPDAARAGARFVQDFTVDRVLIKDGVATGVTGTHREFGATVTISARTVIVSAGSLHSPCLLLRSGLTNPNIGKNLHLHPVAIVHAFFPTPTQPQDGSPLTTAITHWENLDGRGHGVKIEASIMHPFLFARGMPGVSPSPLAHILNFRRAGSYIALLRESTPGSVEPAPGTTTGIKVRWTLSGHDREMLKQGVEETKKVLEAAGAVECLDGLNGPLVSAHQMGSCRMGVKGSGSVVDDRGRVWDVKGLYVCDASVLPNASGVNPMITVMAIAWRIAGGVVAELEGRDEASDVV